MIYTRENPSPAYLHAIERGKEFHRTHKTFTGRHVYQSFRILWRLIHETGARSLLDYGCGKGLHFHEKNIRLMDPNAPGVKRPYPSWFEALEIDEYVGYDPCVGQYATWPARKFDGVIAVDVLGGIPTTDLEEWVIEELFQSARLFICAQVTCYQGRKARDWGLPVHTAQWWQEVFALTASRYPAVRWELRIEQEEDPRSHRRIRGQGGSWEDALPWWSPVPPPEGG